jgi:DNA-binding transcriptional LysR family regulator
MQAHAVTELGLSRRIRLSQLVIFDRVVQTGSIMRTAHDMSMTQPAVTKVIHELETSFDGELFSRSNRGVVPTELGLMLSRRVKSLLGELRYMTEELNEFRQGTAGRVIVGTLISASAYLLPAAITLLKQRAPGISVTVREAPTTTLFPALATGELDIVVGRLPEIELPIANAFPLSHYSLFEDSLSVVMGARHKLDLEAGSLKDLAALPWILPSSESPLRSSVERMFREAKVPLPVDLVESLSILTNLGLLMGAPRVALMPRAAAQQFIRAGLLRSIEIAEAGSFGQVGYSVRASKEHSRACEVLVACLREVAKTAHD